MNRCKVQALTAEGNKQGHEQSRREMLPSNESKKGKGRPWCARAAQRPQGKPAPERQASAVF